MQTFVQPQRWDGRDAAAQDIFRRLRSPEGEPMILDDHAFVERVLSRKTLRSLSEREMGVSGAIARARDPARGQISPAHLPKFPLSKLFSGTLLRRRRHEPAGTTGVGCKTLSAMVRAMQRAQATAAFAIFW
jgi:hypothetical protein